MLVLLSKARNSIVTCHQDKICRGREEVGLELIKFTTVI